MERLGLGWLGVSRPGSARASAMHHLRAALADDMAWARARRPKRCKLALSSGMRRVVAMKLGLNWSPARYRSRQSVLRSPVSGQPAERTTEQIAGWLKRAHPGAGSYQVSHETIYRSLFVQARGVLKKERLGLGCFSIFGRSVRSDARKRRAGKALAGVKSRTWCRSVSARPRSKIGRCRVTGWPAKVICCRDRRTATSRP